MHTHTHTHTLIGAGIVSRSGGRRSYVTAAPQACTSLNDWLTCVFTHQPIKSLDDPIAHHTRPTLVPPSLFCSLTENHGGICLSAALTPQAGSGTREGRGERQEEPEMISSKKQLEEA
eukprot:GHVU01219196.1.p1 GENE.GHVU01219196.1~~GHVU01219196.1.p1  ORF type:complete len:118 (+),score=17.64 GHVU01219196.1:39-392(+)